MISQTSASRQVATLEIDDDVAIPEGFFGTTSEQAIAYEYYGLLMAQSSAMSPNGESECLIGLDEDDLTADGQGVNGPFYYGCRAGAFPATIEVPLDDTAPERLRAQFPEGGEVLHFPIPDGGVTDRSGDNPGNLPKQTLHPPKAPHTQQRLLEVRRIRREQGCA